MNFGGGKIVSKRTAGRKNINFGSRIIGLSWKTNKERLVEVFLYLQNNQTAQKLQ
jgi:hypothetical protein